MSRGDRSASKIASMTEPTTGAPARSRQRAVDGPEQAFWDLSTLDPSSLDEWVRTGQHEGIGERREEFSGAVGSRPHDDRVAMLLDSREGPAAAAFIVEYVARFIPDQHALEGSRWSVSVINSRLVARVNTGNVMAMSLHRRGHEILVRLDMTRSPLKDRDVELLHGPGVMPWTPDLVTPGNDQTGFEVRGISRARKFLDDEDVAHATRLYTANMMLARSNPYKRFHAPAILDPR